MNEKYGDVCVGLDNKLEDRFAETSARIDTVVEGVNTGLESFDAELERRTKAINARIADEAESAANALSSTESELTARVTADAENAEAAAASRHKALETRVAGAEAQQEADSAAQEQRLIGGLGELRSFCTEQFAAQSRSLSEQETSNAEKFQDLGNELSDASERAGRQVKGLEGALAELRSEELAPLGKRLDELQRSVAAELEERLTPLESGMGDMLLKTEYKTGKMLFDMKLDEVVAALGEMNEVIGEMDPADAINQFEDSMRDMEVDVQLALAMTNACT